MTSVLLRPRADRALPDRLALSAAATKQGHADFHAWFAERARAHRFSVRRVPLDDLNGWSFAPHSGNLGHRSGRFFTVEGVSVTVDEGAIRHWQQPIIRQPEVGILGILAKEFDGVLHFLMQAKMEPGNRNLLQLSPTVQATRSNYTGIHRGAGVKYLDYFTRGDRGTVLTDVLQSEHGAWFYRKFNRNVLVEAIGDVPVHDDFVWLTLGQIGELLRHDNLVNMDTRTIIACLPMASGEVSALGTDAELLSWFTVERSRHEVDIKRIPLGDVGGWQRGEYTLHRPDDRYFQVVAVEVEAGNREVTTWSQPLFEPKGMGIAAFLVRWIGGVAHLLVQAKVEAGYLDIVELAPTVQCAPDNWRHLADDQQPQFLDAVLEASPEQMLYEAVHSEEGGRFLNAESRYLFVAADPERVPLNPPAGYRWVTPGQLNSLAGHGHYVNVQARTLLSCLNSGAIRLEER